MNEIQPPTTTPPPSGRQTLITVAVFIGMFALLCWGLSLLDSGSTTAPIAHDTTSATPTVQDTQVQDTSTPTDGEDTNGYLIYPLSVRFTGDLHEDQFPSMTDNELNAEGRDICRQLDNGDTPGDIAVLLLIQYTPQQAGALMGAAPVAFCPAYSDDVETFMNSVS